MRKFLSLTLSFLLLVPWLLLPGLALAESDCPDTPLYASAVFCQVVVPTIFVPGYGASINLTQFAQKNPPPTLFGWSFMASLTPSYTHFFEVMHANSLPYEIAYYDWRLPAQTSAKEYLEPVIEAAKKKYHTKQVDIVAHSFGGLVARAYIEGDDYGGDVRELVEVGTPDLGADKAYSAWEGGVLPPEWKALGLLIRYYQHLDRQKPTVVQALRRYFPSLQDALPIAPDALTRGGEPTSLRCETNAWLQNLDDHSELLYVRSNFSQDIGVNLDTLSELELGPSDCRRTEWPDGKILASHTSPGDGTVPISSTLHARYFSIFSGSHHMDLPGDDADKIVYALYPEHQVKRLNPVLSIFENALSFLFDCPITVTITLPDGTQVSSETASDSLEQARSDDLLWMNVPRQAGAYTVTATATADTPVTAWVDDGPDLTVTLKKGEAATWTVDPDTATVRSQPFITAPTPIATPTPKPTATSTAKPSPTPTPSQTTPPTPTVTPSSTPTPVIAPDPVQLIAFSNPIAVLQRLESVATPLPVSPPLVWIRIPLLGLPP